MLVLSRKLNESIIIDSDIEVQVLEIRNGRVRLGFRAPNSRRIVRAEIELKYDHTVEASATSMDHGPLMSLTEFDEPAIARLTECA